MKKLIVQYKHVWVLSYFFIYLIWFYLLEQNVTQYTPIHIKLDDYIIFNEWFVIPYILWFGYVFITVTYLFFTSKEEFYQSCAYLFIGMTICLIIYTIWPNGQNLRPNLNTLGRDNFLIDLVRWFYGTDTSTNVCPSIHTFNSIACHIAISRNKRLRELKWVVPSSFILMVLICLSTVYLKQHSIVDVFAGIILAILMYFVVYAFYDYRQRLKSKNENAYVQ